MLAKLLAKLGARIRIFMRDQGYVVSKSEREAMREYADYIPATLEFCFLEIPKVCEAELIEEMRAAPEDEMSKYHHDFGRWMRNRWGLWSGSRLRDHFILLGLDHADDMSGLILTSYWRYLHGEPLRVEEQVKEYLRYWATVEKDEDGTRSEY